MSRNVPSERDSLLALALASGLPIGVAAEQVGIDRRTVSRKLSDSAFRRLVADLRAESVATALGRLTDSLTEAADTTRSLLKAEEPHIRLRAARTILNTAIRLRDSVDLGDRIRDLEEELDRRQGAAS